MRRPAVWQRLAAAHTRCGQFFLFAHHALVVPSILVPVVVSLFEASSLKMKYIGGASAATALSLALKLELRAHVHTRTAREYLLLVLEAEHQDVQVMITQMMRAAPLLPSCFCSASLGDLAPVDQCQ